MRILVACEYSGVVRRAFRERGHDAWSCDLLPAEDGSAYHIEGDVLPHLAAGWDMMIAHPPCTHLSSSGAKHFAVKRADGRQQSAVAFARALWEAPIPRIAMENPIGILSTEIGKPTQIVQPWMFGHMEQKATCLWLKGLPPLRSTQDVKAAMMLLPRNKRERLHYLPPSPTRWKERSRTFSGIAAAMAEQWGGL